MKTTYNCNLGVSDSSQVGNVSSKKKRAFKFIFFMYPHVSFSPINWFVETFEVLFSRPPSPTSRQQSCGCNVSVCSLFSTPCISGRVDEQCLTRARRRTGTMLRLRHAGVETRAAS